MASVHEINLQKRLAAVEKIIELERKRKEKSTLKRSIFCRKHGLYESAFSRIVCKKDLPHWRVINRILGAYEAEGIR